MKILFFIESLRSGGRERRLSELIKGLKKDGHEMELVLTEDNIHYKDVFEADIKIHIIKRWFFKKDPSLFFRFFLIAKKFKPDVIHSWGKMTSLYALPSKLLTGIPLVDSSITNTKPTKHQGFQKLSFRFADRVTSNTFVGLEAYNAPANKSSVIYNGFDFKRLTDLASTESIREKFNIDTEYVVAMVGTFYPQKDYLTFIQAANKINKERNDITFLCIGSGDSSSFKEMSENKARILFPGPQSNIESIMNICDVGVLTSNSEIHGEGISNALLEFMALSKPVIATRYGGNVELVEDEQSGYLINFRDASDLANKLLLLLDSSALRLAMGKRSREIVETKFSIAEMIKQFTNAYKALGK